MALTYQGKSDFRSGEGESKGGKKAARGREGGTLGNRESFSWASEASPPLEKEKKKKKGISKKRGSEPSTARKERNNEIEEERSTSQSVR